MSDPIDAFLEETAEIARRIDRAAVAGMVQRLIALRAGGGRLFCLGSGGSAANASHAVNDFRKLAAIEAYSPSDNVSELTARINDDGWEAAYADWLRASHLRATDALLVLSVGGGDAERGVSMNLVRAMELARDVGATILGIVGRGGGVTASLADVCVVIPTVDPAHVTVQQESFQAVIWHLLVSHPRLQAAPTKWQALDPPLESTRGSQP